MGGRHARRDPGGSPLQGAPELPHLAAHRRRRRTSSWCRRTSTTSATRCMFAEREQLPVAVVGGGNNLLVKDRGIRGVVLKLEGCLGRAEFHGEEAVAGAGVSLSVAHPRGGRAQPGRHRGAGRHPRHHRRRPGHERRHAPTAASATSSAPSTTCTPTARSASSSRAPARRSRTCVQRAGRLGADRLPPAAASPAAARDPEGHQAAAEGEEVHAAAGAGLGRLRVEEPGQRAGRPARSRRPGSRASASTARRSRPSTPTSSSTAAAPWRPTSWR